LIAHQNEKMLSLVDLERRKPDCALCILELLSRNHTSRLFSTRSNSFLGTEARAMDLYEDGREAFLFRI